MGWEDVVRVFKRLNNVFEKYETLPSFILKPKQVQCFEYLGEGHHVIAVLPTGFGKSLIYQLLPNFVPERKAGNIVLVVSPLTSIIQDQLVNLSKVGIECGFLQLEDQANSQRYEPLLEEDLNDASNSVFKISKSIVAGKCKILFAHLESLLSDQGRKILRSKIYEENVVACVIDEAHCLELWGEEFRTEFQNLSVLQAFFPHSIMLALTATASPTKLRNLKKALKIENCKVVTANPNRKSIFLKKEIRMSNCKGLAGYEDILLPIATELFERILGEDQYVDHKKHPSSRLFNQYHSPQTKLMKTTILEEIKRENSRIRIIFATTALGMGVNTPFVMKIIHISPPSNIESYIQEIGRAARRGQPAEAILYYNNSDISTNKKNVDQHMKEFCDLTTCLRSFLQNYFGFKHTKQELCCCNCEILSLESRKAKEIKKPSPFIDKSFLPDLELLINKLNTRADPLFADICTANTYAKIIVPRSVKPLLTICTALDIKLPPINFNNVSLDEGDKQ
ncbi:ATP-dependent DNA helicase RecQ-like [Hydractinia symbiolongicarpus]|uniref:ATP-dependent DNA helicase RecQ-like n=1 Tax=Hydractinia symbiolongicarpus TaxID=13093 RepID=UPI00254BC3A1|nr:ATP-dependent DNA helicase RecQ-like [Hydractinia symbiolongicarpus]